MNFYTILQVTEDATSEDIRKAYKRLALVHHPDKNGGDDSMFKQIKLAYETLSHPIRKKEYDDQQKTEKKEHVVLDTKFQNCFDYLMMLFMLCITKDVVIKLDVTIKELYEHKVKKLCVKVKLSNKEKIECLYISLLNFKHEYVFKNLGDDLLGIGKRTDIRVMLNIIDEPGIRIDSLMETYELHVEHEITLYDYYFTSNIIINIFDVLDIHCGYTRGQRVQIVKGAGLPFINPGDTDLQRGDLYIHFKIKLNENVDIHDTTFEDFMRRYFQ